MRLSSMKSIEIYQVPQISSTTWIRASHRPESSFFLCLSISLLEILIKFKSNIDYFNYLSTSIINLLIRVCGFAIENRLNAEILSEYYEIFDLLRKTSNSEKAFEYLNFYSESEDFNCFITLEYTMRFILGYYFDRDDEIEKSLIINDQDIGNYKKAIEKFVSELPITVIIIENGNEQVFINKFINMQANIFLLKEGSIFFIIYPIEFYSLYKNEPVNTQGLDNFPFMGLKSTKVDELPSSLPQNDQSSDDEDLDSMMSIRDERASIRIPPKSIHLDSKFNFSEKNICLINQAKDVCLTPSPSTYEQTGSSMIASNAGLWMISEISCQKIASVMKLFDKTFGTSTLSKDFHDYCECKHLRKHIELVQISEFLDLYVPNKPYAKNDFRLFASSLHLTLHVRKIEDSGISVLMIRSGVDTSLPDINRTHIIELVVCLIKYMIEDQKNSNLLLGKLYE